MKILVAEDDAVSRKVLVANLAKWGYDVVPTEDGDKAWKILSDADAPQLAILDWMMPGMDGVELCKAVQQLDSDTFIYIILLSARDSKVDIVTGLEAGADDYIIKPCDPMELRSRVRAGERIVNLELFLRAKIRELESSMEYVEQLQRILHICSRCKRIRDESDCWRNVEDYIVQHSQAEFSHGICPECFEKHYGEKASST